MLHKPTFMAEYEEYKASQSSGRQIFVDPSWLALYLMTLCVATASLSRESSAVSVVFGLTALS